jgi:3-oxoacyl-[acyl-carrier protein] reductase
MRRRATWHLVDLAEVALFLASPHARWVTGQTIAVDGGQLLGG